MVNQVRSYEAKLERAFNRAEKLMEEIIQSNLTLNDKLELYDAYHNYWLDSYYFFEKKYPYLKGKLL